MICEKDLKIACLSLPDTEVFCSPIFDEYAAEENILHYDQEIADSHHDSHEDAINIVSNSFVKDDCHDDQIVSFEIFKDDDQITPFENFEHIEHTGILVEDSFRSAEDEEDSLSFSDLQGLFDFQLENKVHDQECVDAAYVMGSSRFPDLQIDRSASNSFTSTEDNEGSIQFSDVQT